MKAICENCKKSYKIGALVRSVGDVWWVEKYCTAYCYTQHTCQGVK